MSCSTLQAIWPGEKHENVREFRNSHGTAPIVWDEFCKRYLREESHWWLFNSSKPEGRRLWDLYKDMRIPESHRAAFSFTFDHFYVKRADYRRFAKDLRTFLDDTLVSANHVNHWPLIAQFFEMEPDYPAIALWCTSVTSDPFNGEYDEEKDDYGPFDWSKAYDLYEVLDSVKESMSAQIPEQLTESA